MKGEGGREMETETDIFCRLKLTVKRIKLREI